MKQLDTVVAVFTTHEAAEVAVKKLALKGFEMKNLSVVGKGYHTDEKIIGFYSAGDRIKFWGSRGAFWGGLWGLFFGGLFVTTPFGSVVALGYLAAILLAAIENAAVVGSLSVLGAAIYSMGIPEDSVLQFETQVKADGFLVMAHGTADEVASAKDILGTGKPARLEVYPCVKSVEVGSDLVARRDGFHRQLYP